MFQIDIMSRIPVYEQLIRQTEKFILLGVLKEGDKLPECETAFCRTVNQSEYHTEGVH